MITDYWNVSISEVEAAWYSTGDLMFKNFDYCHFKAVMHDVSTYCAGETTISSEKNDDGYNYDEDTSETIGNCTSRKMLSGVSTNIFAVIT